MGVEEAIVFKAKRDIKAIDVCRLKQKDYCYVKHDKCCEYRQKCLFSGETEDFKAIFAKIIHEMCINTLRVFAYFRQVVKVLGCF